MFVCFVVVKVVRGGIHRGSEKDVLFCVGRDGRRVGVRECV